MVRREEDRSADWTSWPLKVTHEQAVWLLHDLIDDRFRGHRPGFKRLGRSQTGNVRLARELHYSVVA
jgi:hypothetical protein